MNHKVARHMLMKSKLDKTHWGKRIIEAEKRGYFSHDDIRSARNWTTCACGTLEDGIRRNNIGRPIDDSLTHYGGMFTSYVASNDFLLAADALNEIESRAIEVLIAQELNPINLDEV